WPLPLPFPSIDLLHTANGNGNGNGHGHGKAQVDNLARARLIEEALASFGVDAKVVQINQGPTVTQFGIEPGWEVKTKPILERDSLGRPALNREGKPRYHREEVSRTRVRVNRITTLANDLALSLAAPSIRIEAPVPGKPVIGIEVPNPVPSLVTLRSVIESTPFQKLSARSKLALALGIGVSGEPVVADLAKMPHLLIAGATGSGKSVCLNSVIACLLMHATPADVRFILVDPKRVELSLFATIPHLAFPEIVIDVEKVVGALQAVVGEMEARYRRFAAAGARNIEGYNRHHAVREKLPYWVVVIDELADLMMAAPYEVERLICRLAQLARATGIHLVVATQRPSVDVVTGLIKANFPTRIAFAVTSQVDSRTILDGGGAEKLLGRGDMLYMPTDAAKPKRLQGTYVSDQELQRLVGFWNEARFQSIRPTPHALPEVQEKDETPEEDPLLVQARELAQQHSRISASLLQRRLRVGYPRAARLLDTLEEEGIVEAAEGGGSRLVLGREGTSE
ncbi:MAG TPA: DNA translocase FtsK, partial [Dehalococcoidia bacterium]|nr:DNA translocase FtsK [Dehalococcoidia bacterium]